MSQVNSFRTGRNGPNDTATSRASISLVAVSVTSSYFLEGVLLAGGVSLDPIIAARWRVNEGNGTLYRREPVHIVETQVDFGHVFDQIP